MLRPAVLAAALLPLSGCVLATLPTTDGFAPELRIVKDVPYWQGADFDTETHKHELTAFVPAGDGPFPVVVFVPGGGWRFGDPQVLFDFYGRLGKRLASQGIVALVAPYRLAPRHHHPAHVRDVARAVAFALNHAEDFHGDAKRVFVMGYSAGAHLAALIACDRRWLAEVGAAPEQLAGVIGLSGPYDIEEFGSRVLGGDVGFVIPAFGRDRKVWRDASPLTHVREGRPPPFFLAVAEEDPVFLKREAREFAAALEGAGAPVLRFRAAARDHFSIVTDLGSPGDALGGAVREFVRSPVEAAAKPGEAFALEPEFEW